MNRRTACRWLVLASAVTLAQRCLWAQVLSLSGGRSTLYGAQGGTVSLQARSFRASGGAGSVGDQIYGSAQLVKSWEQGSLTLGTDTVTLDLPTDVFDTGHTLSVLGAGVRFAQADGAGYVFAGATANSFNSPFFTGAQPQQVAAVARLREPSVAGVHTSLLAIVSRQTTLIESAEWTSPARTEQGKTLRDTAGAEQVAVSFGLGANAPYAAASLTVRSRTLNVRSSYVLAGQGFRRETDSAALSSEVDRENVQVEWHPRSNLELSVGRQNYLSPAAGSATSVSSRVNQASGSAEWKGVSLSAMASQSTYGLHETLAVYASVGRSLGERAHAQVSWMRSVPDSGNRIDSVVVNAQQTLTPRWNITEMANFSGGQQTAGMGGAFLSNLATLSADWETYYVPARTQNPFVQALILNADLHLGGRATLHGGTLLSTAGKVLYTTSGEGMVSHGTPLEPRPERVQIGDMVLRGRVLDRDGQPVMGASVLVDQLLLFTDSLGYFYVRERRAREHTIALVSDGFLDGWRYRLLSGPQRARSGEGDDAPLTLVVERVLAERVR